MIGHNYDSCIIPGPKSLPPSLRRKMNKFNALHSEEPNEPPRDCNSQPPSYHFKYRNSPPKISPLVSDITATLNHRKIYNGGVVVHS